VAIADGFSQGNDIWHDALGFKGPEMGTHSAESHLDFIGDAQSPCGAHLFEGRRHVVVRQYHLPATPEYAFADERRRAGSLSRDLSDDLTHIARIALARFRIRAFVGTAVSAGHGNLVGPCRRTLTTGTIMFIGTDVNEALGVAMVGPVQHDDVFCLCIGSGHSQCQLIGFTAGADKETDA